MQFTSNHIADRQPFHHQPPKMKRRDWQGNNSGQKISLCAQPIGRFTGRLVSSINRDPRLKMGSFRFPRLIIEAECSSLSADVCFDLTLSQRSCPWRDAAQRLIFASAPTRAVKWTRVPPFLLALKQLNSLPGLLLSTCLFAV